MLVPELLILVDALSVQQLDEVATHELVFLRRNSLFVPRRLRTKSGHRLALRIQNLDASLVHAESLDAI